MLRKTNVNIESGSWRFITLSSRPSETFVAKQKKNIFYALFHNKTHI